jgi:hypothetical protein
MSRDGSQKGYTVVILPTQTGFSGTLYYPDGRHFMLMAESGHYFKTEETLLKCAREMVSAEKEADAWRAAHPFYTVEL